MLFVHEACCTLVIISAPQWFHSFILLQFWIVMMQIKSLLICKFSWNICIWPEWIWIKKLQILQSRKWNTEYRIFLPEKFSTLTNVQWSGSIAGAPFQCASSHWTCLLFLDFTSLSFCPQIIHKPNSEVFGSFPRASNR